MADSATTHPLLSQLLALIEAEAVNPGPIVKALEAYLLTLLPTMAAADKATLTACCAKHGV